MIVNGRTGYGRDERFVIETLYKAAILIRYVLTKYNYSEEINLKRVMWFYFVFSCVHT